MRRILLKSSPRWPEIISTNTGIQYAGTITDKRTLHKMSVRRLSLARGAVSH